MHLRPIPCPLARERRSMRLCRCCILGPANSNLCIDLPTSWRIYCTVSSLANPVPNSSRCADTYFMDLCVRENRLRKSERLLQQPRNERAHLWCSLTSLSVDMAYNLFAACNIDILPEAPITQIRTLSLRPRTANMWKSFGNMLHYDRRSEI